MPARRLAPLMAGTAAGSLGPADLEEIGISIVAVDVLELRLTVGFDRLRAAGGLGAFIGWRGPVVAVARYAEGAPPTAGWRARALPQLVRAHGDELVLRSSVDGSLVTVGLDRLRAETAELGAETLFEDAGPAGPIWSEPSAGPPAKGSVISELAASQAAAGRFWDGAGFRGIAEVEDGQLVAECRCRTCVISTAPYIAHLWAAREITATHLLGWHSLFNLMRLVED